MRNRAQLRTIALRIIVQLEQGHGQQFHILGHAEDFGFRELDEVELFALFGARDVGWEEGVHEGFEVGAVPLGEGVGDVPVEVGGFAFGEGAGWCQAFVQAGFEAGDFFRVVGKVVAGAGSSSTLCINTQDRGVYAQLEEGIRNLKHQDMRMIVLMADQHPLTRPPHSVFLIVLFQSP